MPASYLDKHIANDQQQKAERVSIKWFNEKKGFGFVTGQNGSFDAFLHVRTLSEAQLNPPYEGIELICEIENTSKGKQVKKIIDVIHSEAGERQNTIPDGAETSLLEIRGIVKWYKPDKGFGFITPEDGNKDIFVHQSLLNNLNIEALHPGQTVKVHAHQGLKGREAKHIEIITKDANVKTQPSIPVIRILASSDTPEEELADLIFHLSNIYRAEGGDELIVSEAETVPPAPKSFKERVKMRGLSLR